MARSHQYSKKKPCYFCGSDRDIEREHAPPDTFFKGTKSGRLTVPSCPEHNGEKSERDFAVFSFLTKGVESASQTGFRPSVPEPVMAAIERVSRNFADAKRRVSMSRVLTDAPEPRFDIQLPYIDGTVKILDWMTHLTAALVWTAVGSHDSGTDWGKAISWSPVYFAGPRQTDTVTLTNWVLDCRRVQELLRSLAPWRKGWQPEPPYPSDIYRFEVFDGPEVIFKHVFFGDLEYDTPFTTAEATRRAIGELLA